MAGDLMDDTDDSIFSDFDIPSVKYFQRMKWINDQNNSITYPNGNIYLGESNDGKTRHGLGKLYNENRTQYVEGNWRNDHLIEVHFAQFEMHDSSYMRLNGIDKLITTDSDNYVARIEMGSFNMKCENFKKVKTTMLEKIEIVKILSDNLQCKVERKRDELESLMSSYATNIYTDQNVLQDMYNLFHIVNSSQQNADVLKTNGVLLNKIHNSAVAIELKTGAKDVLSLEKQYFSRNKNLPKQSLPDINNLSLYSWVNTINKYVNEALKTIINEVCSGISSSSFIPSMAWDVRNLLRHQIFHLSKNDVKLFMDLELSTCQQVPGSDFDLFHFLKTFVSNLWGSYIKKLQKVSCSNVMQKLLFTKPVYLQLYKSFLELLIEIRKKQKDWGMNQILLVESNVDLLVCAPKVVDDQHEIINRFKFLVQLMNHFKPADLKGVAFKYEMKYFKKKKSSFWGLLFGGGSSSSFDVRDIPEDYVIWSYYIHYTFTLLNNKILPPETSPEEQEDDRDQSHNVDAFFTGLLDLFLSVMKDSNNLTLEQTRILTQSVISFSIIVSPYFSKDNTNLQNKFDVLLIKEQLGYITGYVKINANFEKSMPDIIDSYQIYWSQRNLLHKELLEKYPFAIFNRQVEGLLEHIFGLHYSAYQLKVYVDKFAVLLRSFNEFINYLRGTKFPWYIKESSVSSRNYVKEKNANRKSYEVIKIKEYLEERQGNGCTIPHHYIFDVVDELLSCIREFVTSDKQNWSVNDKLQAASDLALAIARSFINFDEQTSYEDFDSFRKACTVPFLHLVQGILETTTVSEFKTRVTNLERFFQYTKELTVMSIENALDMCAEKVKLQNGNTNLNFHFNVKELQECYNMYINKFNSYIDEFILNKTKQLMDIVAETKQDATQKEVDLWDDSYKMNVVTKVLAGLSAVWSILQSVDVIGQEKIIKPHCIQILCVLRLLGVDQNCTGVESHLAQVLTGQGKSVVLGLLSAVLALTGNRTRIVCYNSYLSERDRNAFSSFYELFQIRSDITYGTFEDMANDILKLKINGVLYTLRDCTCAFVTDTLQQVCSEDGTDGRRTSGTVLLIDEVDVFFTPNFYGATYNPCSSNLTSEIFANIQLKVWRLVVAGASDESEIKSIIDEYMKECVRSVTIVDTFYKVFYKARGFLNKHIEMMISNAFGLYRANSKDWMIYRFKLNDKGAVVYIKDDGTYSTNTICSYYNIFNYFRLKQNNFDHNNYDNYGYLNIGCGNISYAMLPNEYKTILGVTGTLTSLSDYEVRAVNSYGISRASVMPSFFGRNKLKFNKSCNVTIKETEAEWLQDIIASVLRHVNGAERAVLVFFDTEYTLDKVKSEFASHVGRLRVFTGNEPSDEVEQCVDEAGVCKHVTIATRFMGRGVDYKSTDSFVESNGGVHVIQAFFSDDVKEEMQIKGRTARIDHQGSYELILCREHLTKNGYTNADNRLVEDYENLCDIRRKKTINVEAELAKSIQESQNKHDLTMEFFKTLRNYDPEMRTQLFSKYPFVELSK